MIRQFQTKPLPHIFFGKGEISRLPEIINKTARCPLFLLSPTFARTDCWQDLYKKFSQQNNIALYIEELSGEPSPESINRITEKLRNKNIDLVVAIGGGSVLDSGKAVSAMLCEPQCVETYLEGVGTELPSGKKIFFIAIPTTSGTGSEVTSNAVITKLGAGGFKRSLRHDNYIPNIALIDPSLTLSCPAKLSTACGMDTFTQLVEGYLSTHCSVMTDCIAIDGIKALSRSLEKVHFDGNNLDARTDLSYAALCSGIVLANAGLGTVHGFASTLGGLFPIPHGTVCGTLMAQANRLTLTRLRKTGEHPEALEKYALLGCIFGCTAKSTEVQQDFFIEELFRFSTLFEMPSLRNYGVKREDISEIIRLSGNKNNPAQLNVEELTELLTSRIE